MIIEELIARIRQHLSSKQLPPPASEQELARAEELIGFPLPPLLRALYSEIANGGYGPSYGLLPLFSRHDRNRTLGAIDLYLAGREADLELDMEGRGESWPPQLIPLCDRGGGIQSCVDCSSSQLRMKRYDPDRDRRTPESPSLEQWLVDWLDGKN